MTLFACISKAWTFIKRWVESNVSLTLFIFYLIGLLIPGIDFIPVTTVVILLAMVIFLAYFKVNFQDISHISFRHFILFYSIRFIIFPALFFLCLRKIFPDFSLALLLLALLPPATASPTMSHLFKGNVALSFALLIIGSFLAPFIVPFIISFMLAKAITINMLSLFLTLLLIIVLPFMIFLMIKNNDPLKKWIKRDGSFFSIILIGTTFCIAVAKSKFMLRSISMLTGALLFSTLAFFIFYTLGWLLASRAPQQDKIAYSLGSGANNLSLGLSIALLYFPPDVSLFLIMSEIPWIFAFIPFQRFLLYKTANGNKPKYH